MPYYRRRHRRRVDRIWSDALRNILEEVRADLGFGSDVMLTDDLLIAEVEGRDGCARGLTFARRWFETRLLSGANSAVERDRLDDDLRGVSVCVPWGALDGDSSPWRSRTSSNRLTPGEVLAD